jgi:hypothetical protein
MADRRISSRNVIFLSNAAIQALKLPDESNPAAAQRRFDFSPLVRRATRKNSPNIGIDGLKPNLPRASLRMGGWRFWDQIPITGQKPDLENPD